MYFIKPINGIFIKTISNYIRKDNDMSGTMLSILQI